MPENEISNLFKQWCMATGKDFLQRYAAPSWFFFLLTGFLTNFWGSENNLSNFNNLSNLNNFQNLDTSKFPRLQVTAEGVVLHNLEVFNTQKERFSALSDGSLQEHITVVDGKPALHSSILQELWAFKFLNFPQIPEVVWAVCLDIYIKELPEQRKFLFFHSTTDSSIRLKAVQKYFDGSPFLTWQKSWVFMPELNYEDDDNEQNFQFAPLEGYFHFKKLNFSSLWEADCYIHDISFFCFAEPNGDLALQQAKEHYKSLFDMTWSRVLLIISIGLLFCFLLWRFFYSISAKFILGFLFPFLLVVVFIISNHFYHLMRLDQIELYKFYLELQKEFFATFRAKEYVDEEFTQRLRVSTQEILHLITELRTQNYDFNNDREWGVLNEYLKKEMLPDFYNLILRSSTKSYLATELTTHTNALLQKLVIPLQDITKKEIFAEGNYVSSESSSRDMLKLIQQIFTDVLQDSKLFDGFINSPGRSLDVTLGLRSNSDEEGRLFWSSIPEAKEKELWFLYGNISRTFIRRKLEAYCMNQVVQNLNYYFFSFELWPSFPDHLNNDFHFNFMVAWAKKKATRLIMPVWDNNQLYFYIGGDFEPYPEYMLILKKDGREFYRRIRQEKNFYYFLIWLILGFFWLLALLLSHQVTKPLITLQKALRLVGDGELGQDILVKGQDQFAELTRLFNEMIESLREKELISGFISKMALLSVQQQEKGSVREHVSVLFCGILNIDELYGENEGLESTADMNEFLGLVQDCIAAHGGYIDKFTGQASLSIFRKSCTNPLLVALQLIEELQKLNIRRKATGLTYLQCGIGVATGPVVLGHVGSSKRKDFTAIGNTVNMAARLESLSADERRCGLMIDAITYQAFGENISGFVEIDGITIKGKQQKQRVYRWVG